jgi:uncharacterized tellurite resistance protein B-like protein
MLKGLRAFFDEHIGAIAEPRDPEHALRVAAAALWLEMVRADGRADGDERAAVLRAAVDKFGLPEEEARGLVAVAEEAAGRATDYFEFTRLINTHYDANQKKHVIEHLWRVAFADGRIDPHEEALVRKIADLLHLSHAAFLAARERAREASRG